MTPPPQLKRQLGLVGATTTGLGSIIGTGVFVSIGTATETAGSWVLVAIALAAFVAICNGLNAAQLAANHSVSGGAYEYGYRWLNPQWGFVAGWTFLLAKSASAATAALGFAGYLLKALGIGSQLEALLLLPLAAGAVVLLTLVVLLGVQRSQWVNLVILTVTLAALGFFVVQGLPLAIAQGRLRLDPATLDLPSTLRASALMFVAYAGYARIAVLGEEVIAPRRTIPQAMALTLLGSMVLYGAVGIVGVGLGITTGPAPLETAAQQFPIPFSPQVLAVGAIAAMLGVLLNLILGLSRMVLALARRRDFPGFLAQLNAKGTTPVAAILTVGLAIALITLTGNVKSTWSFSAFSVLIYYAVTNLAALQLTKEQLLFPRWLAIAGLGACLFLAFWVEWQIWLLGLGLIGLGLIWQFFSQRRSSSS
ncbi:MAG: amino acid permease [Oscillatoriales cyanobacterium SM2_2_1]|nr:amino acid permease [Oscillatoriales cyanobacterium SM2_2_1]